MRPTKLALLGAACIFLGGCGGPKWEEGSYPEWKFRVSMPGKKTDDGTPMLRGSR